MPSPKQPKRRPSATPNPFGELDDITEPLSYTGDIAQLGSYLENSFKPKPLERSTVPKVVKKRSSTRSKVGVADQDLSDSVAGGDTVPQRRTRSIGKMAVKYDRNRDGATQGEIARARHVITNVVEVPRATQRLFARRLEKMTRSLTHFLLTEVAPFDAALDTAVTDASESIRLMTGAQKGEFSLGKVEPQLRRITELRTLYWVCERMKVPLEVRDALLADYMSKPNVPQNDSNSILRSQLHELQRIAAMSGQKEGRELQLSQAQLRSLSGSVVAAVTRKAGKATSG